MSKTLDVVVLTDFDVSGTHFDDDGSPSRIMECPERRKKYLQESMRLLKADGKLIVFSSYGDTLEFARQNFELEQEVYSPSLKMMAVLYRPRPLEQPKKVRQRRRKEGATVEAGALPGG